MKDGTLVSNFDNCATFRQLCQIWTIVSNLDNFVTFGQLCHIWTIVPHLDNCVKFGQFCQIWTIVSNKFVIQSALTQMTTIFAWMSKKLTIDGILQLACHSFVKQLCDKRHEAAVVRFSYAPMFSKDQKQVKESQAQ